MARAVAVAAATATDPLAASAATAHAAQAPAAVGVAGVGLVVDDGGGGAAAAALAVVVHIASGAAVVAVAGVPHQDDDRQPKLLPPNHVVVVSQHALSDGAVDSGFDALADFSSDSLEAEVGGDGVDDSFWAVVVAFAHDPTEGGSQGFLRTMHFRSGAIRLILHLVVLQS